MEFFKSFPLLALLVPFMFSFAMPLIRSNKAVKSMSMISSASSMILCALTLEYVSVHGAYRYKMGHFGAPLGIEFKVGMLECIMAFLFTAITFLVVWNSVYRIEKEISKGKIPLYYLLVNILYASLVGMVFTNDIFNAFVFIEVSTLASCGMIVAKDEGENIIAAIKYLVYSSIGSGLILMGMAFLYSITGNLNMDFINVEISNVWMQYNNVVLISMGLFTVGLGIKGAIFPIHVWLPDAYTFANNSSSSLISAIGAKAIVVLLVKVLYSIFGWEIVQNTGILDMLLVFGAAGMIMGSVFAIFQKNIKRRLAYSSVAQMGYIFIGIGLGNLAGLVAAMFHVIGHAITKASLFMSVGSIVERSGKDSVDELDAVGVKMPVAFGIYTVGALSMVGIPVLPGFITKWNLSMASIESGKGFMVAAIILSSILNCIYYLPVVINGYFKTSAEHTGDTGIEKNMDKEKILTLAPSLLLAVSAIAVGIASGKIIEVLTLAFENTM